MPAQRMLHADDREVDFTEPAVILPVWLGGSPTDVAGSPARRVLSFLPDPDVAIEDALAWCSDVGRWAPVPGTGETAALWELLGSVAAEDLGLARMLEPHLDAIAILRQAGMADAVTTARGASTWGVFAAEGAGMRVTASRAGSGWLLDGVKPWCSLAGSLTNALVTAHTDSGSRRLFAVDLGDPGVRAAAGPWVSRGLARIVSAPVTFSAVHAVPVGDEGWYQRRPGFDWGGIGVAACWWGGTVGLARSLYSTLARTADTNDQLALAHLGAVDIAVEAGRVSLLDASRLVDGAVDGGVHPAVMARRTRSIVAASAESVLTHVAHALGPLPLVADESHARRVADLQVYVRQHHAERDEASLGRALLEVGREPW